jgi:hypothetical protein
MAPTDEKTEVVLPAEVPDDLPLPSDQKAACRRIAAQGEPLWKTTRSAEKSFANGWPSEGQAQTEEQVAAFAKKAVQQNEFHRSRRDPDQKFRRDPFEKVMGWLLPRTASRDRAEQRR